MMGTSLVEPGYESWKSIAGRKNEIIFTDDLITTKVAGNKADFYINYLYNSFYFNTQITTVFAGDPSFYKNTVNYQKRFKQIVSPGQYTNHEHPLVPSSYNGLILDDSYSPSKKEVVGVFETTPVEIKPNTQENLQLDIKDQDK